MGETGHQDTRPGLLLLSRDEKWCDSARGEAARLGGARLLSVTDACHAVELLSGGEHFSHLLMHPPTAEGLLPDLIDLTVGEAESGIAAVLLGEGAEKAQLLPGGGRATVVPRASPGWLGPALAARAEDPPGAESELPLNELLTALAAGRLRTRYQPVVLVSDGAPLGLEALARLEHATLGTLPPDRFVPRLEAAGFALSLARLVARRALAEWGGDALPKLGLRLGINLPLDVLLQPDTPDWLEACRKEAGIAAGHLTVELTETHPIPAPEQLELILARLHAAGYRLSIDDVGADLRGDEALFGMPFDSLKLDKDVVQASATDPAAMQFAERATRTAQAAGRIVIAEGIETEDDWSRMAGIGVDAAQGFLIGRPLTTRAAVIWHAAWLRRHAGNAAPG
jgi:EAL domain-containing protein (putative c-di-GMP-specific phosphodiesterase class I)